MRNNLKMVLTRDSTLMLLLLALSFVHLTRCQRENVPYQNVTNICQTCKCLTTVNDTKLLNCELQNFQHILSRWPSEFGKNHAGSEIFATFSGNKIQLLQQLPATNATLTFVCRRCKIKQLQVPIFMDVPRIQRLDLSWNLLTTEELTHDLFRGPYSASSYEPIQLYDLNLSHNELQNLPKRLFIHTPHLRKLDLSYNHIVEMDAGTIYALIVADKIEQLDLSYNGFQTISDLIFKALSNLQILKLAGNKLLTVPENLDLLSNSLHVLNLAGNDIISFRKTDFPTAMTSLRSLNISGMQTLQTIDVDAFDNCPALQYLYVMYNPNLQSFDMSSLHQSHNLTHLDLSACALTTLKCNATNSTWPKLRSLHMAHNPWHCSCQLLKVLNQLNATQHLIDVDETRCAKPYILAGAQLTNLTANDMCANILPQNYEIVEIVPPHFLHKRYIALTAVTVSAVVALGLLLGFLMVYIRRRIKGEDFGVEPIRYTSVRDSNVSTFSQITAISNATAINVA